MGRHSQGVAALAYTLFQYCNLISTVGFRGLAAKGHYTVLSILWKMSIVHLASPLHAFAMMLASHFAAIKVMNMLYHEEIWSWYSTTLPQILSEAPDSLQGFSCWAGAFIVGSFVL